MSRASWMNGVGPKVEDDLVSFVPANIGRFTTYEMGLELVGCYAQRGTYLGYPFPFSTTIRFIGGLYYKGFNFNSVSYFRTKASNLYCTRI